jgi:tagaturonate reductase
MKTTTLQLINRERLDQAIHPEKVIQFGTGVLLRGLVDQVIDQANKQGVFMGSVVQIKSTGHGSSDEFAKQEQVYTIAIRGVENGSLKQQYELNGSISRTLHATTQWFEILELALQEQTDIIVSNTTEAGIVYEKGDDYRKTPPHSFPAKLLALLEARYRAFNGNLQKGYTIVPTELITNNGEELRKIVLQLAADNNCEADFINWIMEANHFCNSLVDRIVSGKPQPEKLEAHWEKLEYRDELLIECEPYLLWAIEGNRNVAEKLGFGQAAKGVIIEPSIEKYRELKLRLLNGVHSFVCAQAFLNGHEFVRQTMSDPGFRRFIEELMLEEVCISVNDDPKLVKEYALSVIDRFSNPFIDHKWIGVALNYHQKMKFRNLISLQRYYEKTGLLPQRMTYCFAWYLHFMNPVSSDKQGVWQGQYGKDYIINDPDTHRFYELRMRYPDSEEYVRVLLNTGSLWDEFSFDQLPGFADAVVASYLEIEKKVF